MTYEKSVALNKGEIHNLVLLRNNARFWFVEVRAIKNNFWEIFFKLLFGTYRLTGEAAGVTLLTIALSLELMHGFL